MFILTSMSYAYADDEYEFNYGGYPYWMRSQCRELTRVNGRTDYSAALQCIRNTIEKMRREELIQSQIEANNAQAELDRELTKEIKHR